MKGRNRRTLALGLLATVTFVWSAIYKFDVPAEDMAWLLFYCIVGVLLVVVLAALCVGLMVAVRKLLQRLRS
jgi:hypothetical protein